MLKTCYRQKSAECQGAANDGNDVSEARQGDRVYRFRFGSTAIRQDRRFVAPGVFRDGGEANAILRLHSANEDFFNARFVQYGIEVRAVECVGPVLDDHGSVRRGFQDIRMNVRASGAGNEKARSLRLIGGVLDEYDGNSPFSGIGNGVDDMGKRFIRIPQGQFAPGEIIVLHVNDDQGFSGRC